MIGQNGKRLLRVDEVRGHHKSMIIEGSFCNG